MLLRHSTARLVSIAAALLALCAAQASAQDKPLKKVRLAVGTSFLNVGYPMNTLPVTLGYWKAEGYDVEVLPVGASLQALQQMVAGNAHRRALGAGESDGDDSVLVRDPQRGQDVRRPA